jgi:hypothetical protein
MVGGMKRALAFLSLVAAAMPSAAAERRYSLTDFDRVLIEGPIQVRLTTGLPTSGSAAGSQQSLDSISVEVQGSTLHVRPNRSSWGGYPGGARPPSPSVTIAARGLRAATVNGSGSLAIDKARGLRLDLTLTGSGGIAIGAVDVDNLGVTMIGAGKVSLAGRAKQARIIVQGSGELAAPALRVDDVQATIETAGNVALTAVRSAKVKSTGAGDVTIAGSAACTVEALGSGAVRCGR